MKKFIYTLLLLPLALLAFSCGDDDKTPDVQIQAKVSNAVVVDNTVYVVKGEPLTVDGISIVNHSGKEAAIGVVNYFLDNVSIGQAIVSPYGFELETDALAPGQHLLTAEMPIYVVDFPILWGIFQFKVMVVDDASELPGEPSTVSVLGVVGMK